MPGEDEIYAFWHFANVILAASAGTIVTAKANAMWRLLDAEAKFLYLGTIFFCFSTIWATVEIMLRDTKPGIWIIISSGPLIWALISGMTPSSPIRLRVLEQGCADADKAQSARLEAED